MKWQKESTVWACCTVSWNTEYKIGSDVIHSSLRASLNMEARIQREWDTTVCAMRLSQRSFLRFSYSRVVQLFPGPSSSRDEGTRILRNVGTTHWHGVTSLDVILFGMELPGNCTCDRNRLCTAYSLELRPAFGISLPKAQLHPVDTAGLQTHFGDDSLSADIWRCFDMKYKAC